MVSNAVIIKRLQELYLYSLYGFSSELKALASILKPEETPNFFARGLYNGIRQMLVITDARVLLVYSPRLARGEVKVIDRQAVTGYSVSKIMFNNSVRFNTDTDVFEMRHVPGKVLDLFNWAMEQPILSLGKKKKKKTGED